VSAALGCSSKHAGADAAAGSAAGAVGSFAGASGTSGGAGDGPGGSADATEDAADGPADVEAGSSDSRGDNADALFDVGYRPCMASARSGSIFAGQSNATDSNGSSMWARFGAGNKVPDFTGCTAQTFGACTAYTCDTGLTISQPPPVSAGTVEVSAGAKAITIQPATNGTYPNSGSLPVPLWGDGDVVTFSATGDVAPAFSRSVWAPGPVTITAPSTPPSGSRGTIDRTKDLAVAWTNGGGALLDLELEVSPPFATLSYEMHCRWPSAVGSGVVPSAALAWIPAKTTIARLSSSLTSIEPLTVGDYCVDLETLQDDLAPSGVTFGGRYDIP
jgi:hypothetical protein